MRIIANRRDTGDALEYQQKRTRSGLIITFLPVNPCCFLKYTPVTRQSFPAC